MKKYTITIFAILGTVGLIYVIVGTINYFKFSNSKPTVSQISIDSENRNVPKLEDLLEIRLVGSHQFIYRFTSVTDETKTTYPIPINSESFVKIIMPLVNNSSKMKNLPVELYVEKDSKYKDIVDTLDLFTQNDIKKYSILKDNIALIK